MDTGTDSIEFITSIGDAALVELTPEKMRVWLGSDFHSISQFYGGPREGMEAGSTFKVSRLKTRT